MLILTTSVIGSRPTDQQCSLSFKSTNARNVFFLFQLFNFSFFIFKLYLILEEFIVNMDGNKSCCCYGFMSSSSFSLQPTTIKSTATELHCRFYSSLSGKVKQPACNLRDSKGCNRPGPLTILGLQSLIVPPHRAPACLSLIGLRALDITSSEPNMADQ